MVGAEQPDRARRARSSGHSDGSREEAARPRRRRGARSWSVLRALRRSPATRWRPDPGRRGRARRADLRPGRRATCGGAVGSPADVGEGHGGGGGPGATLGRPERRQHESLRSRPLRRALDTQEGRCGEASRGLEMQSRPLRTSIVATGSVSPWPSDAEGDEEHEHGEQEQLLSHGASVGERPDPNANGRPEGARSRIVPDLDGPNGTCRTQTASRSRAPVSDDG